jgi:hypothetical protein
MESATIPHTTNPFREAATKLILISPETVIQWSQTLLRAAELRRQGKPSPRKSVAPADRLR